MTKGKLLYWASTLPLCLLYFAAAWIYMTRREMVAEGFRFLGYPTYLVFVLIVAKIAAPIAILTRASVRLSDLAYAGMFNHLLLALSAHRNAGDGGYPPALLALGLLLVSYFSQNAARKLPSPNPPILQSPAASTSA